MLKQVDEKKNNFQGHEMSVRVGFWDKTLTLAIISGNFPYSLDEEDVKWLIQALQKAVDAKDCN